MVELASKKSTDSELGSPALKVEQLSVIYGETIALKSVSLEISAPFFLIVAGGNGSGKTSFLKVLSGALPPSRGSVEFGGVCPKNLVRSYGAIGVSSFVSTKGLYDKLTLLELEQLYFGMFSETEDLVCRRNELREQFSLDCKATSEFGCLSTGTRNKFRLFLNLGLPTRMRVLDEPLIGLDEEAISVLLERLKDCSRMGESLVVATHRTERFEQLATKIISLREGRLVGDR